MEPLPAAPTPASPGLFLEHYFHIGDGGLTVRVEADQERGYPVLLFRHSAWGHGSEIRIMPEAAVFDALANFFKLAAQQAWAPPYCYPARVPRGPTISGDAPDPGACATPAPVADTPPEHASPQG